MENESEENLIKKITQLIVKGNRSRECLDSLRQFYQFVTVRGISSGSLPFAQILLSILVEPQTPIKIRFMVLLLLHEFSGISNQDLLKQNLRQKSYENKIMVLLLPLLISMGDELSLDVNISNFVQWILSQTTDFRSSSIPIINYITSHHKQLLKYSSHIKPLESQFGEFLSRASTATDAKSAKQSNSFFKLSSYTGEPVTELDGTISRETFTILNNAGTYTEDQQYNIFTFSSIYSWLFHLYKNKTTLEMSSNTDLSSVQNSGGMLALDHNFEENIISYCLRLIEQSKLKPINLQSSNSAISIKGAEDPFADIALHEAIRVLDLLCQLNSSLVPRIFPTIKKIVSRPTLKNNGGVFLALLQFYVNHSDVVVHDPEPTFRTFFEDYLSKNCTNSLVALETLNFCNNNKEKLLRSSNIFALHFPPLLKVIAWFPLYIDEFSTLLPTLISPSTCIELFHSLLDMPLLTGAMEKNDQEKDPVVMPSAMASSSDLNEIKYRVLYNYLLRNESGVTINFWDSSTTASLLLQFCKDIKLGNRIKEVMKIVPFLLNIYFDVMLTYADEEHMKELVNVVFQRISQLFPDEKYQKEVRKIMHIKLLAIFEKYPHFVVTLKTSIIEIIGDTGSIANTNREELLLSLCWIIGEYTDINLLPEELTTDVLSDYHEVLELFAYERMSMVKSEGNFNSSFNNRLMLVIISAISKLAARWQPLANRVILCLAKIMKHQNYFDKSVISRANEVITILRFPSVASCILESSRLATMNNGTHVDSSTSLPFMLINGGTEGSSSRLHMFTPS